MPHYDSPIPNYRTIILYRDGSTVTHEWSADTPVHALEQLLDDQGLFPQDEGVRSVTVEPITLSGNEED